MENRDALDNSTPNMDLPDDLRVPIGGNTTGGIKPTEGSFKTGFGEKSAPVIRRGSGNWMVWVVGLFIAILLGATIYLVLNKFNFNTGSINLMFEPEGVKLSIDGKLIKQSVGSITLRLKSGEHTVTASKDGYLEWEQVVEVIRSQTDIVNVKLDPVPNVNKLLSDNIQFSAVIGGNKLAYLNGEGIFNTVNLETGEVAKLFGGSKFSNIVNVGWAQSKDALAIIKIKGSPKLKNLYDNSNVVGRYNAVGEYPTQAPAKNNGISTWLLDDTRQTATGWQPVLLNASIRNVVFAPDSSRIIYFYEALDGEKSLIMAHPDGGQWERLVSRIDVIDPKLYWMNNDKYLLVFDDGGIKDKVFDVIDKDFTEIMQDRVFNTKIVGSPDGTRIAYIADQSNIRKLAVWNLLSNSVDKVFDEEPSGLTWKNDDQIITMKNDGSLWYWSLGGKIKPMQYVSSEPIGQSAVLNYADLIQQLVITTIDRVLTVKL